jgi:hypothetical protein
MVRLGSVVEATGAFRMATVFRFGLETLAAVRFAATAEFFLVLAGLVLATFFFAILLEVGCFRFSTAFFALTVFLALVANDTSRGLTPKR